MKRKLVYYIIFVYSVIIMYLNNDHAQSIPMHLIMYLAPFLLLFNINKINRKDYLPILLMFSIALTGFIHPGAFRISTVLYSMMFIITFIYFTKLVNSDCFHVQDLLKLSRFIILAYAIVLFFQQIGVLFDLPIINENPGIIYDSLKVNSLSNEPSHTGPIVAILFFSYIKMKEIQLNLTKISFKQFVKGDKLIVYSFTYIMIGSVSVTCLFSLFIISLYFINKKHLLIGSIAVVCIVVIVIFSGTELSNRIRNLIPAILQLDPSVLYYVDPSSSARIGPVMVYLQEFNLFDYNLWFGYGCDYATRHVMHVMTNTLVEDEFGEIGGIINFMYNYGMIASVLFFTMVLRITKIRNFLFIIYFTLFIVSPFNVYMTWLFIMLAYCITYFEKQRYLCKSIGNTYSL